MNIHILQHVPFEGPGYIADWAIANRHTLSYTRFYETNYRLPELTKFEALIIMGGPMDVFDEHLYHWLLNEKLFIQDCIHAEKKVLGICLGAQLAALCTSAQVCTAANKEIGWFEVTSAGNIGVLPWFDALFKKSPTVFHWHGDKFQIPYGGYELLRSVGNSNQAFIHNNTLGLQFHLETTDDSLLQMLNHCGHEIKDAPFIQTAANIMRGGRFIPENQKIMAAILHNFLEV